MRTALAAFAALLTFTACDSGGSDDALVGTWTLTGAAEQLVVTSTTTQTLPDLTAEPTGTIEVTGARTDRFSIVDAAFEFGSRRTLIFLDDNPRTATILELTRVESDGPVGAFVAYFASDDQAFIREGEFEPFVRTGAVISVPTFSVDGGAGTVSIGGALTFPPVSLPAGEPSQIQRVGGGPDIEGTLRFTFSEDGTFRASASDGDAFESTVGTWSVSGDQVTVSGSDGLPITFSFEVQGGALRLSTRDEALGGATRCDAECRRFYEGQTLADRETFTDVEVLAVLEFASSGGAAAGAANASLADVVR